MELILQGWIGRNSEGNFVLAEEFGDQFATKEKPWMKSRFTAMLPIKFNVVRNEE